MSKPSLAGREQQQSSLFGLGQKQAKKQKNAAQMRHSCTLFDILSSFVQCFATSKPKKQKIRRKCATVARYSMLSRFLCNALQRDGVQPSPDLAFRLFYYVPSHNSWYGLSVEETTKQQGEKRGEIT